MIKLTAKIPGVKYFRKKNYLVNDSRLEKEVFGLKFKNPVGMAAGFDKNGLILNELEDFGFGFIEIGTVTPRAQEGNPKKRLFRLKKDEALINRMGFNNQGVDIIANRLKSKSTKLIIGGNIGKNTATANEASKPDFIENFEKLHPVVDYFVVNVSCPNVGDNAKLQDKDFLVDLLGTLINKNKEFKTQRPILLKIAPDLNKIQLDEVIEIVMESEIDGIIASNTSTDRTGLKTEVSELESIGNGGLSGKPLNQKSTEVIKYLADKSNKAFPIIGVGGIHSAQDALDKITAGADLVQVYTGFIYEGPKLVRDINRSILKKLKHA